MLGAHAFLKSHISELNITLTFILNFDMIGQKEGKVEIIELSGFFRKPTNRMLNPLAHEVAKELGISLHGFWLPIGSSTDRYVLSKAGIEGIDFFNSKASMATHSSKDTLDRFDSQKAVQNVAIATRMAEKLDETILKNAD